ncbi:Protein mpe1 [Malassezia yamatoensis]|uniref:Protein mpe1 n=1 Tax=Malassezia yamatoensis TaxID=253288 RepID=A0AAJ5YSJ5_9BASI|nr:Protein mpe1 [Malassezia yamatoensis]
MATSAVYYKFRSQKEPQRLAFDGTGISIWDLKREIILQNKMGKGADFDLAVFDADTEEGVFHARLTQEYKDDNASLPRSSHVLVKRLPPSRPGRGNAQLYVSDVQPSTGVSETKPSNTAMQSTPTYRGPMTKRFDAPNLSASASNGAPTASSEQGNDEAARIAAMFQATTEQWDETQEKMAHATYRERGGMPRRAPTTRPGGAYHQPNMPEVERPPPPAGYICYRCGQKGHWIQECPTNDNQDYDNRPRFKRTTGIPKSMLKTVEQPTAEQMSGVMVTPDGSYVIATPDSESWNRSKSRARPLSKTDVYQSVPSDPSLACPYCSKLLRNAVVTPCCHTSFCEECVQTYLFEHDFLCPECEKHIPDIETVKIDEAKRKRVREYIDCTIERSEEAFEQGTKVDEEANAAANEAHQAELAIQAPTGHPQSVSSTDAPPDNVETAKSTDLPNDNHSSSSMPIPMPMPGNPNTEMPVFNPQLVQQLAMMLQNPNLPMPMRMQMQMQMQFQQMLFFQMFPGGAPNGSTGMPPGMPPGIPPGMSPETFPGIASEASSPGTPNPPNHSSEMPALSAQRPGGSASPMPNSAGSPYGSREVTLSPPHASRRRAADAGSGRDAKNARRRL